VSVIEAAYVPRAAESAWLKEVVSAAAPLISEGLGAMAYVYYGAHGQTLRGGAYATADLAVAPELFLEPLGQLDPDYVDRTWRALSFWLCSEIAAPATAPFMKPMSDAGVADVVNVNFYDSSGVGVWLGAPLPAERSRRAHEAETWTRVAAHIGSAFRLQYRDALAPSPDDARARRSDTADRLGDELREAVLAMENARGPLTRRDPDEAVDIWRTLVEGELTLLDHFERGGKRYIVAVANPRRVSFEDFASLPPRERQIVAAAAAGHSNKLIGYELGIAYSTVRVLLARAAKRLGARSRRELVAIVRGHMGVAATRRA
jgi:DNA-binding CsgD family transcriptional regulator